MTAIRNAALYRHTIYDSLSRRNYMVAKGVKDAVLPVYWNNKLNAAIVETLDSKLLVDPHGWQQASRNERFLSASLSRASAFPT